MWADGARGTVVDMHTDTLSTATSVAAGPFEGHSRSRLTAMPAPDPMRIVIVHGNGISRAGLHAMLSGEHQVVGAGPTLADAFRAGRGQVAVVDDDCADDAARAVADGLDVVLLLRTTEPPAVMNALRVGARGLVQHDVTADALNRAVRDVARGGIALAPMAATCLVDLVLSRPERLDIYPAQLDELTVRERQVLELVACGFSNDEIAERLVISAATAKTHVSRTMVKLHVHHRAALAVIAFQCGLVTVGGTGGVRAAERRISGRTDAQVAA